ncbi:MAG: NADH-quinone oxidoreductase subunit NuoK [Acidimicrobiales bacterium]
MLLNQFLILAALLFCIGVYGVLSRRNGVMVLMSIELILNAVNINLVAFSAYLEDVTGQVFSLFVIAVAAAEVGVGLAMVLMLYRNRTSIDLDEIDLMKG